MKNPFSKKKDEKTFGKYYSDSTQKWLPIETVTGGLVLLKDGRYIKILEVLPVNFYLKSDVEQENIICYKSMKEMERALCDRDFARCHTSYIVNLFYVLIITCAFLPEEKRANLVEIFKRAKTNSLYLNDF